MSNSQNQNGGWTPPPMNAPTSSAGFTQHLIDAALYPARLVWLVAIGTQRKEWKGEAKLTPQLVMGFELPTELLPEDHPRKGEPCFISEYFTFSMGDKSNLRAFINQWRGKALSDDEAKAFDIGKMVGQPAAINVVHRSSADGTKTYANIGSISNEKSQHKMYPGWTVPPQVNKTLYFNVSWLLTPEGAKNTIGTFNELPKYLQEKAMASQEWIQYTVAPHYIAPTLQGNPAPAPQAQAQPQAQPQAQAPQAVKPNYTPDTTLDPMDTTGFDDDGSDLPF